MKTAVINSPYGIGNPNFVQPPAGVYNFFRYPAAPAFQIPFDAGWNVPPQVPNNPIDLPMVFDYPAMSPDDADQVMIVSGENVNTNIALWQWYFVELQKLNAHYKIDELLGGNYGVLPIGLVVTPDGKTREEYQSILDSFFINDRIDSFQALIDFCTQNLSIADELTNFWETFDFLSPQSIFEQAQDIASGNFQGPEFYSEVAQNLANAGWNSRADGWRMYKCVYYMYNNLSAAYGTGENWYPWQQPERANFWERLWSGIKRLFPGLIVARNAALILIKFNFRGLATRFDNGKGPKLKRSWEGLGGSYGSLLSNIDQGKNKPAFLGDPTVIAAAITVGLPLLFALVESLINDDDFDWNETLQPLLDLMASSVAAHCEDYNATLQAMIAGYAEENTPGEVEVLINSLSSQMAAQVDCEDIVQQLADAAGLDVDPGMFTPDSGSGSTSPDPFPETGQTNGDSQNKIIPFALLGGISLYLSTR